MSMKDAITTLRRFEYQFERSLERGDLEGAQQCQAWIQGALMTLLDIDVYSEAYQEAKRVSERTGRALNRALGIPTPINKSK